VQDGEYSMVSVSPEILLRDGSFFWKVIISDEKCTISKCLHTVVISKCHLVWGWHKFRKDCLSLRAIRTHFQYLSFVVLSARIIPNLVKFFINSIDLCSGLHLYKAAIDRQSITQMVPQIDPAQGYAQLSVLIPITGAAWRIPKSINCLDTFDECISISTHVRNGLSSSIAKYRSIDVRPFHTSLEVSLREEYLTTSRPGETRVLVCTGMYHITKNNRNMSTKDLCIDPAGMGVDIPDIEVFMQWKISSHLIRANIWQCIGRAGRDPEVKANSVLYVDRTLILPNEIPEGSEWAYCDLAGTEQPEEGIRVLIKCMYQGVENGYLIATAMPYYCFDQPILRYVNTMGSHS
jgi:superfamily II DNA helicase RecQ